MRTLESNRHQQTHMRIRLWTAALAASSSTAFESRLVPPATAAATQTFMTRRMASSSTLPDFGSPSFGLTKKLSSTTLDQATAKLQEELKKVGFGVITTIDMKQTLANKLEVDLSRPYVILGACNPRLAHQALQKMPSIGLLLPCNIVVTEDGDGNAVVSALNPQKLFGLVEQSEGSDAAKAVEELASDVQGLIEKVMDAM